VFKGWGNGAEHSHGGVGKGGVGEGGQSVAEEKGEAGIAEGDVDWPATGGEWRAVASEHRAGRDQRFVAVPLHGEMLLISWK
jgi:hypothetical protein